MNLEYYLGKISEAMDAATLHSVIQDARADGTLTETQLAIIQRAVNNRFGQLNAPHANHKPRW